MESEQLYYELGMCGNIITSVIPAKSAPYDNRGLESIPFQSPRSPFLSCLPTDRSW
jgi:hypothetical protein